ncbi:MAG: molybdate ABC transporter substrate-binding protein [Hylemonella sp.]
MPQLASLVLASVLALSTQLAQADTLKVLTTGAYKQVLMALVPGFEARTGHKLEVDNDTAGALSRRIAAGETFDVLVLTPGGLKPLAANGKVVPDSVTALGRAAIGVAVKEGTRLPGHLERPASTGGAALQRHAPGALNRATLDLAHALGLRHARSSVLQD